jgi:hypothetical protein
MEKPVYFGIAVYEEPWESTSIGEGFQGSSAEEVKQKLEGWIEQDLEQWDQDKRYYSTIVWVLHPDGSVSYSTDSTETTKENV